MHPNVECIIYNYLGAGHGKGATDGIGGASKRTLDRCVAHGQDIHYLELALVALQENYKNLTILEISEHDIVEIDKKLPSSLTAFIGTLKVHQFKWVKSRPDILKFNSLSCYDCAPDQTRGHYSVGEEVFTSVFTIAEPVQPVPKKSVPKRSAKRKIVQPVSKGIKRAKRS